jgi:hypothetical protein
MQLNNMKLARYSGAQNFHDSVKIEVLPAYATQDIMP